MEEMMNNRAYTVAPRQRRNIRIAVLVASRRTQPKTISLLTSSRGNMVRTSAARKRALGVFPIPCRGASVA
jgi:hypothetical protein